MAGAADQKNYMNDILRKKIVDYYTVYYRDDCSLPDWPSHVEGRLTEEALEAGRMKVLERDFGFDLQKKKHLIVGAGSGGLAVALKEGYDAEVFGVEPDAAACEIIYLRCREHGIPEGNFHNAYGEDLPFENSAFDFVHCFTVLEHVSDVEQCIDEMLRVLKSTGRIIINTPNHAYPQERHYKIYFPTFLPKFMGSLYLMLRGKNPQFFSSINLITERSINKILVRKENIRWLRVYSSFGKQKLGGLFKRLTDFLIFNRFIYPQQDIVIFKKNSPDEYDQ